MVQWVKVLSKLQSFLGTLAEVERKPDSTELSSDRYMFVQIYISTLINNEKIIIIFKVMKCTLFLRT